MKKCNKCKLDKPVEAYRFNKKKPTKNGKINYYTRYLCRDCEKEYNHLFNVNRWETDTYREKQKIRQKLWRIKNRERINQYNKLWRAKKLGLIKTLF